MHPAEFGRPPLIASISWPLIRCGSASRLQICDRRRKNEKKHSQCASMPELPACGRCFDECKSTKEKHGTETRRLGGPQRFRRPLGMQGHEPLAYEARRFVS